LSSVNKRRLENIKTILYLATDKVAATTIIKILIPCRVEAVAAVDTLLG